MEASSSSLFSNRVVIAMSGGVDSSVAAAQLVARGYEVIGVTLHLWDYPDDGSVRGRCCAPEDQHDARRVADQLGIAHYAFDRRDEFLKQVVNPFVEGYVAGETPSPCVSCNRTIKIRELFRLADRLGAYHLATGHYARVVYDEISGEPWLARAADRTKDQSYFLHSLTSDQLRRVMFPLGECTKARVRQQAHTLGLSGASKGESQELCFVPSGSYREFVESRLQGDARIRPGPIVAPGGQVVGHHEGIHRFTVGQRKGLGVSLGKPTFVARIDPATSSVYLGDGCELDYAGLLADESTFPPHTPVAFSANVKVRARHEGAQADLRCLENGKISVTFCNPVRSVTVGQYIVAYDGERVLGGAKIVRSLPAAKPTHETHALPTI